MEHLLWEMFEFGRSGVIGFWLGVLAMALLRGTDTDPPRPLPLYLSKN